MCDHGLLKNVSSAAVRTIGAQDFLPDFESASSCVNIASIYPRYQPISSAMQKARKWIADARVWDVNGVVRFRRKLWEPSLSPSADVNFRPWVFSITRSFWQSIVVIFFRFSTVSYSFLTECLYMFIKSAV